MKYDQEISALFDAWNEAIQSGDPDRVTALYAFNGILLPTVSNQVRHNHAEIRDYFVHFLAKKPKGTINESNIRVYNDIAINSGVYTFDFSPPDGEPFSVTGRFTYVYQWFGDHWLIIEHHSSMMPEK
ncbi:SgcJ/EcaC family oxidoreductase [Desulfurivibrio alkaliphilus]|uniref:Calcium/calmodulin dependent protein kinase II association-domain protein n=1 Tax=Desulfurivibrio alkaliphilus (strain DSM 19089 / UNIQEM U267 / AHT2) TaxID=589865 RepID=D6Z0E7_DESAT|nr:SgcJ/EcaC family oxidoreductase [Desulfurivibrio alkaliphilus]ADH87180.1 Calcium/calmodulin dependent protein kinase II association-domain protein [Desulfurivibrio alkaliphilus AHT 2]